MITLKDIAEVVGVSKATVSIALSDKKHHYRINKETRDRVRKAAEKLGYHPNELARAMLQGQTKVIGYLAHLDSEYDAEMFTGFVREAKRRTYNISVVNPRDFHSTEELASHCLENRFRAIVCRALSEKKILELHGLMAKHEIPMAVMASSFAHSWGVRVISDDVDGMRQLIKHLKSLGHRRIAHVTRPVESGFAYQRRQGFIEGMLENNLNVRRELIIEGTADVLENKDLISKLMGGKVVPTAITCGSDYIALQVLRSLHKSGFKVPAEVSVTGFGDLSYSKYLFPALTTVRHPCIDIGIKTAELLIERCEHTSSEIVSEPVEVLVPVELVIRESTTALKKK